MLPSVIDWLDSILQKQWNVLEAGSGGSTVFLAQRVAAVVSYEHDEEWYERVKAELESRSLHNVTMRLWAEYPKYGLDYAGPFDLALIDGRGRVRSLFCASRCIRPGGWLVLDDSQRRWYAPAITFMECIAQQSVVFGDSQYQATAWKL